MYSKYYGLPKIHKKNTCLRSIISSRRSVTYRVAKELAMILKPQVGQLPHHVPTHKDIKLTTGKFITSYVVIALFTSVPVEPAIQS